MKRIEKLTDSQIARFPEFVEKWTNIGLCTDPPDRSRAAAGIRHAYETVGRKAPQRIVWCQSPLSQGWVGAIVLGRNGAAAGFIGDSVGASVWDSVRDSVWASVAASVRASVRDSVRASVRDSVFGQHDAHWLAFYDYFRVVVEFKKQTQRMSGLWEVSQSANWWLPHENICWVSERHNILNRNSEGRLHCDGGPALAYPDGWCIWSLNGVRVDQWLAETPSEQLDCRKVVQLENVEQRREGVRKVGAERLLWKLGSKTVDRDTEMYELVEVDLGLQEPALALKMANPSVPEVWHVEFVPRECETVQHALNFRNGFTEDQIDDVNGVDWIQQGDVVLKPIGATKFKSRPSQLT